MDAFALLDAEAFAISAFRTCAVAAGLTERSAFGAEFCFVAAPAFFRGADALRAAGAVDLAAIFVVRSFLLFTALLALADEEALADVAALAGTLWVTGLPCVVLDFVCGVLACGVLACVVLGLACGFALFKGARAEDAVGRFPAGGFGEDLRAPVSASLVFVFGAAAFDRRAAAAT